MKTLIPGAKKNIQNPTTGANIFKSSFELQHKATFWSFELPYKEDFSLLKNLVLLTVKKINMWFIYQSVKGWVKYRGFF